MGFQLSCFLFFCAIILSVEGTSNCNVASHFYEELGCKKVKYCGKPCRAYYNCPEYKIIPGHCRYQGVQYKINTELHNTPRCIPAAHCTSDENNGTKIIYALYSCVPLDPIKSQFCYSGFTNLNSCCTSTLCVNSQEDAVTCTVNGKTIYEGQMYTPASTCNECLCKKDYDKKPFCQKKICGTEIHHSDKIQKNCAPIYRKNEMCCPSTFVCEEDCKDLKIIIPKYKGKGYAPQCRFGNKWIPINGRFNTTIDSYGFKDITCSCDVPPLVTCTAA